MHQHHFKGLNIHPLAEIDTLEKLKSILEYEDIDKIKGYRQFEIKQKKSRTIYSPNRKLKLLQKKLNQILLEIYNPPKSVHAYVYKKSIKSNALIHVKNKIIYNTDIKDFFPSINNRRVSGLFRGSPFNFNIDVANELTKILTYKGMLPQGAPTSPIISNMICLKLDICLLKIAKKYHVQYSRYADDITFSCNRKMILEKIIPNIETSIKENDFEINRDKTRISYKYNSQCVTGLKVNEFLNVDRKFIKKVQSQLHAWKKYGYDNAHSHFLTHYDKHRAKNPPKLLNVLYGKLNYLKHIRGEDNQIFIKLAKKFNKLYLKDHAILHDFKNVHKITYNDLNEMDEKFFVIEYNHWKNHDPIGTAFVIHGYPYLITCNHVVGKYYAKNNKYYTNGKIFVTNYLGIKEKIYLVDADSHCDIAILTLPSFLKNRYSIYNASIYPSELEAKQLNDIEYFGFPDYNNGDKYSRTKASVTNIRNLSAKRYIEVDKTIKAGNSGGPALFDYRIVGLCTNGDHTMPDMPNKIIDLKHIIEVLERQNIPKLNLKTLKK